MNWLKNGILFTQSNYSERSPTVVSVSNENLQWHFLKWQREVVWKIESLDRSRNSVEETIFAVGKHADQFACFYVLYQKVQQHWWVFQLQWDYLKKYFTYGSKFYISCSLKDISLDSTQKFHPAWLVIWSKSSENFPIMVSPTYIINCTWLIFDVLESFKVHKLNILGVFALIFLLDSRHSSKVTHHTV